MNRENKATQNGKAGLPVSGKIRASCERGKQGFPLAWKAGLSLNGESRASFDQGKKGFNSKQAYSLLDLLSLYFQKNNTKTGKTRLPKTGKQGFPLAWKTGLPLNGES